MSKISNWINYRLPISSYIEKLKSYEVPNNLNFLWNLGFVAGCAILLQIISGIFLAVHYIPHIEYAFASVLNIIENVNYGWFIQGLHEVGASLLFLVLYLHIFKAMYYKSYKFPRELVWIFGVFMFHLMIFTAFMGYVLPMNQMSYWSGTVITNLIGEFPIIGKSLKELMLGGDKISTITLTRFFVFHMLLPFSILFFAILHIFALHQHGSNNPLGNENVTKIPFFPKYFYRDMFAFFMFLLLMALIIFFVPEFYHSKLDNVIADKLSTPDHIVPEWYFLPYFAILKVSENKIFGIILFFISNFVLYFIPWLDRSKYHLTLFHRLFFIAFVVNLIWLGSFGFKQELPNIYYYISVSYYFIYFCIILPLGGVIQKKCLIRNV